MTETRSEHRPEQGRVLGNEGNLSKRVRGTMQIAFGSSPLELVGGTGKKGELRRRLMPVVDATRYRSTGDPLMDAEFNTRLLFLTDVLLGNTGRADNVQYVNGIGGNDVENLIPIGVDLASQGVDASGTVFRMVFGATERMPLRALSYPLPALQKMDEMARDKQKGIVPPQLQIVFANNISGGLNRLAPEQVLNQTRLFVDAERMYLERFFPHLADRVVFLTDTPQQEGSAISQSMKKMAQALAKEGSDDIKDKLLRKGVNLSEHSKIEYGAAHLLFHDVVPDGLLKPVSGVTQSDMIVPQTIISMGGFQERDFYQLRFHMKDLVALPFDSVRTLQLFTRHRVPPYYMANGGDVPLSAIAGGMKIADAASYDLKYLERESFARGDYSRFISDLQKRMAA